MAPDYTSEIFHPSHSRHNTRMSTYKLDLPFHKNVHGQKTLSYLGPKTRATIAFLCIISQTNLTLLFAY